MPCLHRPREAVRPGVTEAAWRMGRPWNRGLSFFARLCMEGQGVPGSMPGTCWGPGMAGSDGGEASGAAGPCLRLSVCKDRVFLAACRGHVGIPAG